MYFKRCLPANSSRVICDTYEEVYVPAVDRSQVTGVHQINIEDFDEVGELLSFTYYKYSLFYQNLFEII